LKLNCELLKRPSSVLSVSKGKPERFELLLLWLASVLSVRLLPPHPTGVHGP